MFKRTSSRMLLAAAALVIASMNADSALAAEKAPAKPAQVQTAKSPKLKAPRIKTEGCEFQFYMGFYFSDASLEELSIKLDMCRFKHE
jgi:hypothetical protein